MFRVIRRAFQGRDLPNACWHSARARSVFTIFSSVLAGMAFLTGCSTFGGSMSRGEGRADPAAAAETERALAVLNEMSAFLAAQPTLRYASSIEYDAIQPSGQKVEFGSQRKASFARPNRARVEVSHRDGGTQNAIFDGQRLSVALPEHPVYATMEYSGTTGEAFDYLNTEYGFVSPLLDLVRRDLTEDLGERLFSARTIGSASIGGVDCDHLAFMGRRIDFQIFIQQGERPLPMRLVIDYHGEPGSPQFRSQISGWDLSPQLPEDFFRFVPPPGAQRVPFPELLDLILGPVDLEENDE